MGREKGEPRPTKVVMAEEADKQAFDELCRQYKWTQPVMFEFILRAFIAQQGKVVGGDKGTGYTSPSTT